ncbi:EamA-like transporter family protein [Streptococcus sp. oral taxon 056 str. F0418]|uniref:DMT family transporter n=1 Tax=Streptococcus sp. oral taxon 056 TaxID=712620 RepID=UPI000218166C|nr:DMT family transporter [Streptococcus sp. oral taxon 056]EGP66515.1 EamA-like transporter family protein [Streptococcus sp. oral taxon 056 str. F0418]
MSKMLKGTIYTLVAGIAWGLSGTSGQYLMVHGFSALSLTNVRLLLAGLSLMGVAYFSNPLSFRLIWKDKQSLTLILIFALFGLFLNQYAYLEAIHETNAGTATVLQYLCPVGILAYTCIKDKVAPTVSEIFSMILAVGGTFLIATHGQLNQLSMTPKGLLIGLFSAFTYSLYILLPIDLIKKWGSMLVIGIGMTISSVFLLPFSGLMQHQWLFRLDILLALIGIIVIGTIFAYTLFLKGTTIVGPVKSSLLASIEPISAVFFAFLIMREHFYILDIVGMAMILMAVLLISLKDLWIQKKKGIL